MIRRALTRLITREIPPPPPPPPPPQESPEQRAVRLAAEEAQRVALAARRAEQDRRDAEIRAAWDRKIEETNERRRKEIERQRVEAVKRGEIYEEPKPEPPRYRPVMGTGMLDYGIANASAMHGVHHHHYH